MNKQINPNTLVLQLSCVIKENQSLFLPPKRNLILLHHRLHINTLTLKELRNHKRKLFLFPP